ncbi:MAG: helix-turn-helix transcriptional regulator [Clostridia bacterium]|nr:helix-turn-helix transcriptional regulator [Clostridia bacterium]
MNAIKIDLSSYKNALNDFHMHKVSGNCEAQKYHEHNYFQMYYILKGYITHQTEFGATELAYGDIFIIPPNYKHAIKLKTSQTEFYSCSFSKNYLSHFFINQPSIAGFLSKLLSSKQNAIKMKLSIPDDYQIHLQNIMDLLLYEYQVRPNNIEEIIQHSLGVILSLLSNIYFTNNSETIPLVSANYKNSIVLCLDYIKEHVNQKLSLNMMTKLSHMPRKDFCLEFKKITGCTFNTCLNKLRIEKALAELKSSNYNYTVRQIAIICGYDHYATFYRNFIKYVGISPEKFIQSNTNFNQTR